MKSFKDLGLDPPPFANAMSHDGWPTRWVRYALSMYDVELLKAIAAAAVPPSHSDEHDLILESIDGWRVAFFYDCGSLDYIDHFITPSGETIDFWEWPLETPGRDELINFGI